jgi:hypothetical protein
LLDDIFKHGSVMFDDAVFFFVHSVVLCSMVFVAFERSIVFSFLVRVGAVLSKEGASNFGFPFCYQCRIKKCELCVVATSQRLKGAD